ncbi:oligoendopeptidase F [Alicyclobacillus shizuokensis]|uniref:oligoendopeptidase F n=1 Tax=Alicyclobacillus shizuokensis TaxID=392014 RepID=UPI000A78DDA1|nr:oligoendopeptidase F [Alicyclobacillus shizuokensis]
MDQAQILHPLAADAAGASAVDVPTREEIDEQYKWHLEDMYPSLQAWEKEAQQVRQMTSQLRAMKGTVTESPQKLLEALRLQDQIGERLARLYAFARMRRDENNANATYQALTDKATALWVETEEARSYFVPEVLAMDEATLRRWVDAEAELGLYRFVIEEILREKPHVLSGEEEQILAAMGEVGDAPSQIFTMFNNADIRFPKVRDDDGQEVELTHGRYLQFLESRNREVREGAFRAMYETYGKHRNTLAAIYGASVKKDVFYARVRRYPSAREMALFADDVPVSVYDNLIEAVHEALPALHKYLSLRKRVLGLDELHLYDLYTPIVAEVDMKVPYEEAVETVLEAVSVLGSDYRRTAENGVKGGWVDVYETRGKTSGAYSWGAYGVHPFILLNYRDTLDNMFTLAHELGHAMHTHYSHSAQPYVYSSYTIFVAEVASTLNENLLLHHLLGQTDDPKQRAYLLNHQLETIRGTLFRQTMFAEFEKLTHEHVEAGEALTPEWLCDTYYRLNEQFFGAVCIVDKDIALEWSRIPHFYTPFYVYKYATGLSAATALAQKILSEGRGAVSRYIEFLKSGGSDHPIPLLRKAGVDMESPEPVRSTLELFSQRVDELEGLLTR